MAEWIDEIDLHRPAERFPLGLNVAVLDLFELAHGVYCDIERAGDVGERLDAIDAEILPHGTKEINADLILRDLVAHGHQAGQNKLRRISGGLAARRKLRAQFIGIQAKEHIRLVSCSRGILGADTKLFHCVAELVDGKCAGCSAVFQRRKKLIG